MKHLLKTALLCSSLVFTYQSNAQEYNPYESIGQEAEVLTLTKGKYIEFFDLDSIEVIGDAILNTNTMKVIGFVEHDTLYSEATLEPEIVSRWWAPDPVMQPQQSPYLFVANNPIIYVDPNGEDNVIYLVALPSSKSHFSVEDMKSIAAIANANYQNLGLETRVVVFESNDPFDPAHIDPNDSYVLLGSSSEITSTVSGKGFTSEIQDAAKTLISSSVAEESATTNNKFEQGILIESSRVSGFASSSSSDKLGAAAFLIIHGAGHNAGINKHVNEFASPFPYDKTEIMYSGNYLTSNNTSPLSSFLNPSKNSFFIERLSDNSYFGDNEARANYNFRGVPFKNDAQNPKTVKQTIGGYGVLKNTTKASKSAKITTAPKF